MAEENRPRALADDIGGQDEGTFPQGQDQTPNHAGRAGPAEGRENHDNHQEGGVRGKSGGEGGPKGEEKVESRDGHEEFRQAHGEGVSPPPQIASQTTDGQAEDAGEGDSNQTDAQGDARAVEEPGEDIAAGGIAAEKIDVGWRLNREQVPVGGDEAEKFVSGPLGKPLEGCGLAGNRFVRGG